MIGSNENGAPVEASSSAATWAWGSLEPGTPIFCLIRPEGPVASGGLFEAEEEAGAGGQAGQGQPHPPVA